MLQIELVPFALGRCQLGQLTELPLQPLALLLQRGLPLTLERFECLGSCNKGPNIKFSPGGKFLHHVRPDHLESVVRAMEAFACKVE